MKHLTQTCTKYLRKPLRTLRHPTLAAAIAALVIAAVPVAQAENGTWTGGTSVTWSTTTNWSGGIVPGGTSANADIATFNSATYSFQPTAASSYFLGGLVFESGNTGGITITTGTANNRVNIGSSGILLNEGTGVVFIGASGAGTQGASITANQNWTNNSSSLLTVNRVSVDDASAAGTYTLTINGSGTGGVTFLNTLGDVNNLADATRLFALVINSTGGNTTLSAANTFTGGTTLTQGNLLLGNNAALGTGTLALNGGKISSNGTGAQAPANNTTIGGDVTIGDATNTGALTFSGTVGLGAATRTLTLASNATFSGVVSNGGITKLGAGTLTLSGAGANTYSGLTTVSAGGMTLSKTTVDAIAGNVLVNGGTLTLGAADQINNASNVEVAAGTFSLATFSDTVNNVKLTGGTITGTTGVLISATAFDFQSSGNVTASLAGTAGANKTTSGTVTFTGSNANTYTGLTTVSAGSLILGRTAGVDALAGDVLVNGTGTLQISNANQIKDSASVEVGTGGTFVLNSNAETVNGVKLTGGIITGAGGLTSLAPFDFQSSGNVTAVLAGTAGANKTTAGTVTFSGSNANTYTGLTTVSAGNLTLTRTAGVNALAGDVLVNGSGTLTITNANQIKDTANMEVATGGTFAMGGNAETVNGVKLTGGTITASSAASLTSSTAIDLQSGISGVAFTGTVGANKTTAGSVLLTGASTYSGSTTLTAGTLQIGVASVGSVGAITSSAIGTGSLALNGGTISSGSTAARTLLNALTIGGDVVLGNATNTGALTFSATTDLSGGTRILTTDSDVTISGIVSNGGITKAGSGSLILSGANTFSSGLTINSGTVKMGAGTNGTVGSITDSALGTGSLTFNGGTLQSSGATNRSILNAATFGGDVTLGAAGTGNLTFNGGVDLGGGTRSVTVASTNVSLNSVVSNGALSVSAGTNSLTVTAANTYSGGTTVTSGTLVVNNTTGSGTGSGTVTVNSGATLAGDGIITTGSNNYVYLNGTLQVGSSTATQGTDFSITTSGTGSTIFGTGSNALFDLWSTTGTDQSTLLAAADLLRIFGDLTLTSGSTLKLGNPNNLAFQNGDVFKLFDWASLGTRSGTFSTIDSADLNLGSLTLDTSNLYTTGTISIMSIPEPSRALLMMLGFAGALARRRRTMACSLETEKVRD